MTVARLRHGETGAILAEAFHFPLGRPSALHDAEISAALVEDPSGCWLELATDLFAQSVNLDVPGYRAADNWFHLAPGDKKRVRLVAEVTAVDRPQGVVRSLGSRRPIYF